MPPAANAIVSAHEPWQTRYEQLRSQVLQTRGTSAGCGCGHALLLQRGLAAWMRAWPATTTAVPLPSEPTPAQDAAPLPWSIQQQLAHILVNTILDHVQEISA